MGKGLSLIGAIMFTMVLGGILIVFPASHVSTSLSNTGEINEINRQVVTTPKNATPEVVDMSTSTVNRNTAQELSTPATTTGMDHIRIKREDTIHPSQEPWFQFWEVLGLRRYGYGTYF